jgi:post-segregation antitoxin (ccd killing protein)
MGRRSKVISLTVDEETLRILKELRARGINVSALFRNFIKQYYYSLPPRTA